MCVSNNADVFNKKLPARTQCVCTNKNFALVFLSSKYVEECCSFHILLSDEWEVLFI